MRKKQWFVLGTALMLGMAVPVYAKEIDQSGIAVEESVVEEKSQAMDKYEIEIGDTLKEGIPEVTSQKRSAASLSFYESGVNFYDQLTKTEKTIYNYLKDMKVSEGKIEFQWPEDLSFSAANDQEFEQKRAELRLKLNRTMQTVIDALSRDYPELYWLDIPNSTYLWKYRKIENGGRIYYDVSAFNYNVVSRYTKEEVENLNQKISRLKFEGDNRYEKVKAIHDYLCETVTYLEENPHIYEPYGALMDGAAVCEGYGEAFKWLCDEAGIPCVSVSGVAVASGKEEAHLWNYVQMEDEQWYAVDVTWDDSGSNPSYSYFLVGSDTAVDGTTIFSKNHKSFGDFSGTGYKEFQYPTLNTRKYDVNHEVSDNSISYSIHVQDFGWMDAVSNGAMGGTTGKSKRVEAMRVYFTNQRIGGSVEYTSYVNGAWQNFVRNGAISGTTGKSSQLEAIKIRLTGEMQKKYDIYYRTHVQDYGWMGWALNGSESGTADMNKRMEAVEIRLIPKGQEAPGNTDRPFVSQNIAITYSAHVQNLGWQDWVSNGAMAGTSGKSLRLEAIKVSLGNQYLDGTVEYRAHMQNLGWQPWVVDGQIGGKTGKSLQLEAVQIRLTDELAEKYNIIYRAHVQNLGWQDWVSNGKTAGTSGKSLRVEGIEIRLEKK